MEQKFVVIVTVFGIIVNCWEQFTVTISFLCAGMIIWFRSTGAFYTPSAILL